MSQLAPMPSTQMPRIHCRIPRQLLINPQRAQSLKLLEQEVEECYFSSLRKGIGKRPVCYLLFCKKRLTTVLTEYAQVVVHTGVCWEHVTVRILIGGHFFRHLEKVLQHRHRKNEQYRNAERGISSIRNARKPLIMLPSHSAKTWLGSLECSPYLRVVGRVPNGGWSLCICWQNLDVALGATCEFRPGCYSSWKVIGFSRNMSRPGKCRKLQDMEFNADGCILCKVGA